MPPGTRGKETALPAWLSYTVTQGTSALEQWSGHERCGWERTGYSCLGGWGTVTRPLRASPSGPGGWRHQAWAWPQGICTALLPSSWAAKDLGSLHGLGRGREGRWSGEEAGEQEGGEPGGAGGFSGFTRRSQCTAGRRRQRSVAQKQGVQEAAGTGGLWCVPWPPPLPGPPAWAEVAGLQLP